MAIAVLLLWALTASAGLRLLFTSGLGRSRSADASQAGETEAVPAKTPEPATAGAAEQTPVSITAGMTVAQRAEMLAAERAEQAEPRPPSKQDIRRAERARWDTPELERSRAEPAVGARELVEFTHPACAIIGLAFWLGYTLVHNRVLAWIAFGLAAVTACVGLAWFVSNRKNALFSPRLIAVHGGGAAFTFVLAALTALTARG
jgi:hypothetical protein